MTRRYTPSPAALRKEPEELRLAFDTLSRLHTMLTDEGVPAGEIEWRVAYVLAQIRSERDPWSEPTPTPAAERRMETP